MDGRRVGERLRRQWEVCSEIAPCRHPELGRTRFLLAGARHGRRRSRSAAVRSTTTRFGEATGWGLGWVTDKRETQRAAARFRCSTEASRCWPYGSATAPSSSVPNTCKQESGSTQLGVPTRGRFHLKPRYCPLASTFVSVALFQRPSNPVLA